MLSKIVKETPIANITRYTLKASTFPGKMMPIKAPVFVCIKVSDPPQRQATPKHNQ